ncbi:stage II sporulation protein D [Clostridium chauvoei]|uniref:stage II sporulation protein D n=1 Tax=Clostridium chauvoei TaxID=46867 RepID=UPI001C86612C|nr:stage II sporulation protein D [Clostridium chauvoei]MBX7379351.1 stage II sporulation protein D [Clostridium chauvoei]
MKKEITLPEGVTLLITISVLVLFFMIAIPVVVINSADKSNSKEAPTKPPEVVTEKATTIEMDGSETIKVFITNENKVIEVPLEEYVQSVVSGEMPASFEPEALKAQAIAARTYVATKKLKQCEKAKSVGAYVCDTTHCQVYLTKESRMNKWSEADKESNWKKIEEAVSATKGQVLTYDGNLVMYPQFFATSSGKTENSVDVFSNSVPYLVSTESSGEEIAPKFTSEKPINIDEFINTINSSYPNASLSADNLSGNIEIIERSEAGGVKQIRVGKEKIKGTDFRHLLKLNSTNFQFEVAGNEVVFKCKGYGHGVGMSQWGANVMAKEGKGYEEILAHYYTGIELKELVFK